MLKDLNLEELVQIQGGTKDPCYEAGHRLGKAIGACLAVYGIYSLRTLLYAM